MDEVNDNLRKVQIWCNVNKCTINLKKTNNYYVKIKGKRQILHCERCPIIPNTDISEVNLPSFVGIQIDSNLTWKAHIQMILNKCIRKKLGILCKENVFHNSCAIV